MLINLAKCAFLVCNLLILGYQLFQHNYQLGRKALGRMLGACIPRTVKQVQELLGKLNFAGKFCPDFAQHIRPLKRVLRKAGS